jgi:hypothetical protein
VSLLILVVDDEADVEVLFRQQFRHDLRAGRFTMEFARSVNGAVSTRNPTSSPGRYAGMDNAWIFGLVDVPLSEFNKSIVQYPNMTRFPGGASNDMIPNLQNPKNPLPYDPVTLPKTIGAH